jgi:hypothetical protein
MRKGPKPGESWAVIEAEAKLELFYDQFACEECAEHHCRETCPSAPEHIIRPSVAEYDFTTAINTRRHERLQRDHDGRVSRKGYGY